MFNFKYIKDRSQAGSWRRGYDYYQKKQVLETTISRNTITGKVKGNFQAFYTTKLKIDKNGDITAACDCPLEEEWCKHAIAVGLNAIETGIYQEYIDKKNAKQTKEETPEENQNEPLEEVKPKKRGRPKKNPEPIEEKSEIKQEEKPKRGRKKKIEEPEEVIVVEEKKVNRCRYILNPSRRQKFGSIQVIDNSTNMPTHNIEVILKELIDEHKETDFDELNPLVRGEILLLQELFKNSRFDRKSKYFDFHFNQMDKYLKLLCTVEEVIDSKTKNKITFDKNEWKLVLSVNVSTVGNVLLALHWHRPEPEDVLPFEEIRYYSRGLKWFKYKNIVFRGDASLSVIPHTLTKSTFTDIRDADGGRFLYEELPQIRKFLTVEMSPLLEKLTLEERPPLNVLTLTLDDDNSLRGELSFEYDGMRVPYGRLAGKTPYVTIKNPEENLIYWVKRNVKHEELAYKTLQAVRFTPMQTNNLHLDSDSAIDFYNFFMERAGKDWKIEEKNDLSPLKVFQKQLNVNVDIDFAESVDSFKLSIYCSFGREKIDFEEVEKCMFQGQKYFTIEGKGQVEVPHTKLMILSKTLNSYDAEKIEEYTFSVKTFRAGLIAELKELGVKIKMSDKFSKFWEQISTFNIQEETFVSKNVKATLREYQLKGISWLWFLYQYGLNGILADDMGLGKTLQILSLLQRAKDEEGSKPTLVICPTSVVFNWENEIEKFTPGLKVLNLTGNDRHDLFKQIKKYDIILTSYALVRRDIVLYQKFDFRCIVLDESQNIKNHESQTAMAVKKIQADHRFALSGTPIENRLSELWSIFDFLMPGFLYDLDEFKYRFTTPIMERGDKTVENRLKKQIYPFILRRMKRDVARDLPDKVENLAYCTMSKEQENFYQEVLEDTRENILKEIEANGFEKSKMSIFAALLRLRQICCHPRLVDKENKYNIKECGKFEHLKEMLEEITSEGHRVLLFSQFVTMLDIIKEWFDETGIKYEYLTGQTKDRKERVDNFNNNEDISVFLLSLKAGGTGLNLTGADYVIHYDPWWNPAVEDQATDRAYRIGQTKKVIVYRLITKNSVEEKIQKLKRQKRDLVDSIISVDKAIGKSLSYEDIRDILSVD